MSFKLIVFTLIAGWMGSLTSAQSLTTPKFVASPVNLPKADSHELASSNNSELVKPVGPQDEIVSPESGVDSDWLTRCRVNTVTVAIEEPHNPAESSVLDSPDDGPFSWLWEESTTTRSMYEQQASKVKHKSNATWLDWFPNRKSAPKSPGVQLENISPFPTKRHRNEEPTMWESTKDRWFQWNRRMKDSTHRNWLNLKEKWSGE